MRTKSVIVLVALISIALASGLCGCSKIMGKALTIAQDRTGIVYTEYGDPVATSVHVSNGKTVAQFKMKLDDDNALGQIEAKLDSKYSQQGITAGGVPRFEDSDIRDDLDDMDIERIYEGRDASGSLYIVIARNRSGAPYLYYFG